MQISVETRSPVEREADLLALPLPELDPSHWRLPPRAAALNAALQGAIAAALGNHDFKGARGQTLLLYGSGPLAGRRVLLVGLGPAASLSPEALREAAAVAVREAMKRRAEKVAVVAPPLRRLRLPAAAQALAEGAVLGGYRFDRYRTTARENGEEESGPPGQVRSFAILAERAADLRAARAAAGQGARLAECQNLARDLSNEPPNELPPAALARAAQRVAKEVGLRARILEPAELRRRRMGALLAVAGGSSHPPRVIVLEHNPPSRGRKGAAKRRTVCLVGKGVTFDSGGLSLKPSQSMVKMKHDMSGGAAVIATLRAAALLRLPLHVVGVVGAVENLPSATAYRPDDILRSASGQTIEVTNTDAEGRLVLADALHFARTEFGPAAMIDLATLTGACNVALGPWAAAVIGNDDRLADLVIRSGETSGERFWRLPLWDEHRRHMRSQVADVRQTGGPQAGTITAAAFLSYFAGDTPWIHLDIASTAETDNPTALQPKGATGFSVRTLVEVLRGFEKSRH